MAAEIVMRYRIPAQVARTKLLLGLDRLFAMLLLRLLLVVAVMVVMSVDADALPLSAPCLLLFVARAIVARAQAPAVLLVPCAQWLATECEVVVFDDGGDHPWVAAEVDFAGRGVGDVEVGDQQVGLRGPVVVCALWRRHGGCIVFLFCDERMSPSGGKDAAIREWRPIDIATAHQGVEKTKRRPRTKKAGFGMREKGEIASLSCGEERC